MNDPTNSDGIHYADADMTEDPKYQAWVDELAKKCRCSTARPCDGLLAGGLCDDIQWDEEDEDFDCMEEDEAIAEAERAHYRLLSNNPPAT